MVNAVTDKVLVTNGLLASTDTVPTPDNWLATSNNANSTSAVLDYNVLNGDSVDTNGVARQWLAVVAEPARTGLGAFLPVPITTGITNAVNSTGTLDKIKFFQRNANSALGWQSSDTINIRDIQSYTYNAAAGHTPYAWVINFSAVNTGSTTPLAFGDRLRLRFYLENHPEFYLIPSEVEAVYQEATPSTTAASLSAYIDSFVELINITFYERWKIGYTPLIAYAGNTTYTTNGVLSTMSANATIAAPGAGTSNCIIVAQNQVITDYSGRIDNLLSAFRMFPKSSYDNSAQNEEFSGWDQFGMYWNPETAATTSANTLVKGTLTPYVWTGATYSSGTFPINATVPTQATLGSGTARQVEDHLTKTDKGYRGFSNRIWMPSPITDQLRDGVLINNNMAGTNTATAVFDTHILEYYDHFRSVSGSVTNRNILKRLTIYNYRGAYTPGTNNTIGSPVATANLATGGGQVLGSVDTSTYITNLMRILGV